MTVEKGKGAQGNPWGSFNKDSEMPEILASSTVIKNTYKD